ncbi:hypothetical protein Csa_016227 [Cucumis sativus]|uniref:Uncharacterized protein n=1 Tax=Cucumis sativus TaxID=3659 RepID=A0A0A0K4M9_CUCSA|nr:hypothetical protein Csa_016227 [Cucumis sativus]
MEEIAAEKEAALEIARMRVGNHKQQSEKKGQGMCGCEIRKWTLRFFTRSIAPL